MLHHNPNLSNNSLQFDLLENQEKSSSYSAYGESDEEEGDDGEGESSSGYGSESEESEEEKDDNVFNSWKDSANILSLTPVNKDRKAILGQT